jgi:hypothetical protein
VPVFRRKGPSVKIIFRIQYVDRERRHHGLRICYIKRQAKVKQSHYKLGKALRVPGG